MDKKTLLIGLLITFCVGNGFLFAQNMMYYTSDAYKYTIQLPEDWKRSDEVSSEQVALVMLSNDGAELNVSFFELNGLNKEDFIERFEQSLPGNFEELSLEEKGVLKSRDDQATYMVYDYSEDGIKYREKVCFFNRDAQMVLITANSKKSNFHESLPIFEKIFKSFTFETEQEKIDVID